MQLTIVEGFATAKARNAEFKRLRDLIVATEHVEQLTDIRSELNEYVTKIRNEQVAYGRSEYDFDHAAEIVDIFVERLKLLNLVKEFDYENR